MCKKIFFFVLCWLFLPGRGYSAGFVQEMDVEIGVFDAAHIVLDYNADKADYRISAEVKTANLFDTLYPFTGRYESVGKVLKDKLLPRFYLTKTQSRNHIRTKKILYNNKGVAYQRISTKDKKENTVAIKDVPASANAADLQTVFAELIQKFSKTKSCVLNREVYDGKKHYRVIAEDKGTENRYFEMLKREENAYRCSIYIENLKENNDNILWDVSAEKPIHLWIGVDMKAKMPYVLEIGIDSTPLGELNVTPRSLNIKK